MTVVTPYVAKPDAATCIAQSVPRSTGAKSTVHSTNKLAEATTRAPCTAQSVPRPDGPRGTVQSKNKLAMATARATCTAHSVPRPTGTKSTVHSKHKLAEATADQRRAEDPRHWLQVPLNNLNNNEELRKRKVLAEELMGEEASRPVKIRGLMVPRMRALDHPAAPLLKQYASQGCPVDVGRDWTLEELEAAVEKGPHSSALEPDAIEQIQVEAREKVKQGFAKIYTWEWLKENLHKHPQLKLSPLAMIPHKSRKYRAILDLSYQLLVAGYLLPSVNDATKDCAPEEAISQIGTVLPRIIEGAGKDR